MNESTKHSRDKRAAEIQDSIRQVLVHDWDPIGVSDNPKLRDEYDSYVAPVYRILAGSRSEQELTEFLFQTVRDTMWFILRVARAVAASGAQTFRA